MILLGPNLFCLEQCSDYFPVPAAEIKRWNCARWVPGPSQLMQLPLLDVDPGPQSTSANNNNRNTDLIPLEWQEEHLTIH